jgi:hypothetical protein
MGMDFVFAAALSALGRYAWWAFAGLCPELLAAEPDG